MTNKGCKRTEVGVSEIEISDVVCQNLYQDIYDVGLLVVGETHGVQENADIVYMMLRKFGIRTLMMEWSSSELEEVMDSVLRGKELSPSIDGRVTVAYARLVGRLFKEGLIDDIIPIDVKDDYEDSELYKIWNDRDRAMAEQISTVIDVMKPSMVVVGSRHASREPKSWRGHPHITAGSVLGALNISFVQLLIDYQSGSFYNNGQVRIFEPDNTLKELACVEKVAEMTYTGIVPVAHAT